jgi:hypothetical protein
MPRYALLEHTGAPDDPSSCHYDLLLEDGDHCRAWRLPHRPAAGEAAQAAVELAPHRLVWLTPRSAAVSGGRGWARGIVHGHYAGGLPREAQAPVIVRLLDGALEGWLRLESGCCVLERCTTPTGNAP